MGLDVDIQEPVAGARRVQSVHLDVDCAAPLCRVEVEAGDAFEDVAQRAQIELLGWVRGRVGHEGYGGADGEGGIEPDHASADTRVGGEAPDVDEVADEVAEEVAAVGAEFRVLEDAHVEGEGRWVDVGIEVRGESGRAGNV